MPLPSHPVISDCVHNIIERKMTKTPTYHDMDVSTQTAMFLVIFVENDAKSCRHCWLLSRLRVLLPFCPSLTSKSGRIDQKYGCDSAVETSRLTVACRAAKNSDRFMLVTGRLRSHGNVRLISVGRAD
jgi:hypothetical protein